MTDRSDSAIRADLAALPLSSLTIPDADWNNAVQRLLADIAPLLARAVAAEARAEKAEGLLAERDQRYVDVRQQRDEAEAERDALQASLREQDDATPSARRSADYWLRMTQKAEAELAEARARVAAVEDLLAKREEYIARCEPDSLPVVWIKDVCAALAAASPPEEPSRG